VRVSVCLASISPEPHARSLPFLCILPIAVARSSCGFTKSQGEGAILGVFFPIDIALYSIAFRIHTKTVESIEMPFRLMTRVSPGNYILDRGADPPRVRDNFQGLSWPFKSIGNLCCNRRYRVRCKRDYSIANNVMQQTGSFSVPGKRK